MIDKILSSIVDDNFKISKKVGTKKFQGRNFETAGRQDDRRTPWMVDTTTLYNYKVGSQNKFVGGSKIFLLGGML